MELIKNGKTKDVYKLEDGNIVLKFKDTITGLESGESDPGGNRVVGAEDGIGTAALNMSCYFFELLNKSNILTHYISADLSKKEMLVKPAKFFGNGLEFVVRYKAAGSFIRRFGSYIKEGDILPKIFEVTLKDDEREDPPLTKEILVALNILTPEQYDNIYDLTMNVCNIIKDEIDSRNLDLIDIKVEFGLINGNIALIDEVSPGNMRVLRNAKKLDYITLSKLFL